MVASSDGATSSSEFSRRTTTPDRSADADDRAGSDAAITTMTVRGIRTAIAAAIRRHPTHERRHTCRHPPGASGARSSEESSRPAPLVATLFTGTAGAVAAPDDLQPGPEPTIHTQEAYAPEDDFTAKWTRADARQLQAPLRPRRAVDARTRCRPRSRCPTVPQDFPDMSNGEVWVWDSWPLTDEDGNQYSVNGQEIIFSLVADRSLGFDERHVFAKIGYFFRPAGIPADERPENGGWTYGGLVFDEGVTGTDLRGPVVQPPDPVVGLGAHLRRAARSSCSSRMSRSTATPDGNNIKPYDPRIALSVGKVHANKNGVKLTGFDKVTDLLQADGTYYQTGAQNEFFNFRDPFTFEDPAHPGETYMVFEGNSAMPRESATVRRGGPRLPRGRPVRRDGRGGQRLGRDLPDRQHRPREGEERRAHRVGVPAADPVGELRHRPDRASAVRASRTASPTSSRSATAARSRTASTVPRASTASSATASAATSSR